MTIPSHLHSEMRLQNFLTKRNFRAGSWQKFAQRLVIKGKGRTNLSPSGRLKNVFSGKQLGLGSRRDACSFQHTHATGDREDNVE